MKTPGRGERRLLAIVDADRLRRVLKVMLDEARVPVALRHPRHLRAFTASIRIASTSTAPEYQVDYEPAESTTDLFGGNSNWRGPIWFPINYLLIEALQKFHHYYGDEFTVECPTGSGQMHDLWQVAEELSRRLSRIFLRNDDGRRPVFGGLETFQNDPHWRDLILFHEYFHGDNGAGVGASHQTGWTALVAKLLQQSGE